MAPLAIAWGAGAGGGGAESGPVTTGSGGTMAQPLRTNTAPAVNTVRNREKRCKKILKKAAITTMTSLDLCQPRQHLIRRLDGLAVHFVGPLSGNHVNELFSYIDVRGFNIVL